VADAVRVLLVGGSGFIGGHVARALVAAGHRVTVMSRGTRPLPAGTEPLHADRADARSIAAALEGRRWDITFDFTAFDAGDVERLLLVPYAALGRYVMISTGQVYLVTDGARPPYREPDSAHPLRPEPAADADDHPSWAYGVGKRRAESALLALRATHGVRATILRLPNIQGEGDGSLRLWAWLERFLDGGPVLLPDGGVGPARPLYVGDVARLASQLVNGLVPREPVYNLAQPETVTVRELLERIARAAGVTPRFVEVPWDELFAAGLNGDCAPYASRWSSVLDPSRAASEWGFAGTRLDDYLPAVVRWHLEHRPVRSHVGYATRARERAIAGQRMGTAGVGGS